MKKAEEYLQESFGWGNESQELTWYVKSWKDFIKRIQEDTIRETVKECNNYAKVRVVENALIEEGETYSSYDDGVFTFFVDDQSILSIADKLIKEL